MTTYLDHQPWTQLILQGQFQEDDIRLEAWQNLKRFLKRETDLVLNLPQTINYNDLHLKVYDTVTSGRGESSKVTLSQNDFRFKRKAQFQQEIVGSYNFFILDDTDKAQFDKWKKYNGFIIENGTDLLNEWIRLRQIDTIQFPKSFTVRKNVSSSNNLKNFNPLEAYKHSCTDFVIADRYIFSDKAAMLYNLKGLLNVLIEKKNAIVGWIFGAVSNTYSKDASLLQKEILTHLSEFPDLQLNIVMGDTNRFKEHDRCLISNYFFLKPGDSFYFFKPNGEFRTNGTSIDIKSLFDPSEMKTALAVLANLSLICEESSSKCIGKSFGRLISKKIN